MSIRHRWLVLFIPAFLSIPGLCQTTPTSAQGVTILGQALSAAGGRRGLSSIQDFTASGTITYFWAGKQGAE